MKLSFNRQAMLPVLSNVVSVVSTRSQKEIMQHVYCEVKDDALFITAADDSIELSSFVVIDPTLNTENGHFTLPAKKVLDICRMGLGEDIKLTIENQTTKLQCGRNRSTLQGLDPTMHPKMMFENSTLALELNAEELLKAISSVEFSMARNDARYFLNGMKFEFNAEEQKMLSVGTDGHRLALCEIKSENPISEANFILPANAVLKLKSLLKGEKGTVKISMNANTAKFELSHIQMITKLVDGRYPDYRRVLPRNTLHHYTINREAFKSVLQRVSIFSEDKFKGVRLTFENNEVKIATKSQTEDSEETLDVQVKAGGNLEIGLNISYVLDILNALQGEEILFEAVDSSSQVKITEVGNENNTYIVMPMRL